jgi:hypothetical protein
MTQSLLDIPAAGGPDLDRGTLLRLLVRQRHWQKFETFQVQFARAAARLAQQEGEPALASATISARSWERWLTGKVKTEPRPDACRVLEHMFGHPVCQLLRPASDASLALTREKANQVTGAASGSRSEGQETDKGSTEVIIETPAPVGSESPDWLLAAGAADDGAWDVEEMERRELLRLLGGAGLVVPLASGLNADALRRRLDSALSAPTTKVDVAEWERVAAAYSMESAPPATLLPELLTDLDEAMTRLQGAPASLRPPMARVCGQLSALTAMNYANLGNERSAVRYWRTALRVIDHADDRSVQAELYADRASFALLERHPSPSTALALADHAISIAAGTPCAGAANGYAARAMALALLGDHRESIQALADLADTFGGIPGSQTAARSCWGYSEQQLRFVEGFVNAYASHVPETADAIDAGIALVPHGQWIAVTSFEVTRAVSIIRGGDPSEGARHVVRAIQALPPGYRQSVTIRRAALAIDAVPVNAANAPSVVQARELLALPPGTTI